MNEQTKEDTEKAKKKTQEDTDKAKGKSFKTSPHAYKRSPHAKLTRTHREHPEYHLTQAAARERMGPRQAPSDLIAPDGAGIEDGEGSGIGGATSDASEGVESIPTPNAMGKIDPFYVFDRPITSEEITDQGIHDTAGDVGPPAPISSFNAIICVNGKPFSAAIQGNIGNEITD
jgi:hypothetical protein|tara:strand:+ start:2466 stop:2987 length:522 start_codon:yes stop_codon:yes gene_type:complete